VFGVEADIDYSDMDGDDSATVDVPGFVAITTAASTEYNYFGSLRGRLGAAFERFLVYGTGGLAYADVENSASLTNELGQDYFGSSDDVQLGWTVGGGVEVAVTDNVTLGAEALYFDLGDENVDLDPVAGFVPPAGTDVEADFENTGVIARARLTIKFGGLFGG
jgi:outer membrane immunogenic protein